MNPVRRMAVAVALGLWITVALAAGPGPGEVVLHIDPVTGDDGGDGSADRPWRTIDRLWQTGGLEKTSGASRTTVLLGGGYHGSFVLDASTPLAGPVTFQSAAGEVAVITVPDVTRGALRVEGKSDLEFRDIVFQGSSRLEGRGVDVRNCRNVLFKGCEVVRFATGMLIRGSEKVDVVGCHIHQLNGSGIKYLPGNRNCLFESNHIHDSETKNEAHASAISIRSGDVIIRGNIFHDGFNSSCLMTYGDDMGNVYSYSNILIENNLIFDIINPYLLRFYKLAQNVVVRNNTMVGSLRGKKDGRYALSTALVVHSYAPGGNPSELTVDNNIMMGIANIPQGSHAHNNILWSFRDGNGWSCDGPGGSMVFTCSYGSAPFEKLNALFREKPELSQGHGRLQDFRPAPVSLPIGFGDPARQAPASLGLVDAEGWIRSPGPARNIERHSAGAYELGASEPGASLGLQIFSPKRGEQGPDFRTPWKWDIRGRRFPRDNPKGVF